MRVSPKETLRERLPPLRPMHRWCNGNIPVSKTVVLGSNPSLCVVVPLSEKLTYSPNGKATVSKTVNYRFKSCVCNNSFFNLHGIDGAEAKWSSGTSFKRVTSGFKSRLHCQTLHRSARLSVWATVCKTAASCVAGATPARPTNHGE